MSDLLRRHEALLKTKAKYDGKPFAWGKSDCVSMARSHLVAMKRRGLPKLPRYSSPEGAKRALKGIGFGTIEGLLDSLLVRIAPAEMLPGDLALMQGDNKHFDALTICLGQKFYGWHAASDKDEPVAIGSGEVSIFTQIKAAYRA